MLTSLSNLVSSSSLCLASSSSLPASRLSATLMFNLYTNESNTSPCQSHLRCPLLVDIGQF